MIAKISRGPILVILFVLVLAAGTYLVFVNMATSGPVLAPGEDGDHSGYIRMAYEKDGGKFIDIDYIETLTGKDAAIRELRNGICLPEGGRSKEQVIEDINRLQGSEDEIAAALYKVPGMGDCGPNGWWLDVNDDFQTKTFELNLREPIVMAYDRSSPDMGGFGPHEESEFGKYGISWETFRKVISGAHYDIPFEIRVSAGKVISIMEIYRP